MARSKANRSNARYQYDRDRPTRTQRGYNARWVKARARYLKQHKYCVACRAQGKTVEATEVDHIQPHEGDSRLFWRQSNWQALCKSCHSRKTMLDVHRRREPRRVEMSDWFKRWGSY